MNILSCTRGKVVYSVEYGYGHIVGLQKNATGETIPVVDFAVWELGDKKCLAIHHGNLRDEENK